MEVPQLDLPGSLLPVLSSQGVRVYLGSVLPHVVERHGRHSTRGRGRGDGWAWQGFNVGERGLRNACGKKGLNICCEWRRVCVWCVEEHLVCVWWCACVRGCGGGERVMVRLCALSCWRVIEVT